MMEDRSCNQVGEIGDKEPIVEKAPLPDLTAIAVHQKASWVKVKKEIPKGSRMGGRSKWMPSSVPRFSAVKPAYL